MGSNDDPNTLGTLERGFEVVSLLMREDGARVTEVAEELGIAPSTAHKYLSTLHNERFVVKEGDEYQVGMRFLTVGGYAKHRNPAYEIAAQKIRSLADQTGERAQFVVAEHGRAIYTETIVLEPTAVMTDRRNGRVRYLHSSAAGKAILARYAESEVREVIDRWGLPAETENTITDPEALSAELDRVESDGVAFNDEESIEGLRSVGAAVTGTDGETVGAISVSGPANRLKGDRFREELPDTLLGVVNEIELTIAYS
jgi:DNA-binding IclR family transcriptional regulator